MLRAGVILDYILINNIICGSNRLLLYWICFHIVVAMQTGNLRDPIESNS